MNKYDDMYKKFSDSTPDNNLYEENNWLIGAVETGETLQDFENSRKSWNECKSRTEGELSGFKYLCFSGVQIKKGDIRRAMTVVDFGELRVVLDFDAKFF
jgi:hypothetical protein